MNVRVIQNDDSLWLLDIKVVTFSADSENSDKQYFTKDTDFWLDGIDVVTTVNHVEVEESRITKRHNIKDDGVHFVVMLDKCQQNLSVWEAAKGGTLHVKCQPDTLLVKIEASGFVLEWPIYSLDLSH